MSNYDDKLAEIKEKNKDVVKVQLLEEIRDLLKIISTK